MVPHPLTNFEIQKYYRNEPKFDCVYSRNNLSKIKDRANVINLDEYESKGTHWIALFMNGNNTREFLMKCILIAFELNIFQEKLKNHRQQKFHRKYL